MPFICHDELIEGLVQACHGNFCAEAGLGNVWPKGSVADRELDLLRVRLGVERHGDEDWQTAIDLRCKPSKAGSGRHEQQAGEGQTPLR